MAKAAAAGRKALQASAAADELRAWADNAIAAIAGRNQRQPGDTTRFDNPAI